MGWAEKNNSIRTIYNLSEIENIRWNEKVAALAAHKMEYQC